MNETSKLADALQKELRAATGAFLDRHPEVEDPAIILNAGCTYLAGFITAATASRADALRVLDASMEGMRSFIEKAPRGGDAEK